MTNNDKNFEELINLFNIAKKKELIKHCKNLQICKDDLFRFILLAQNGVLPYKHIINHRDFVSEHLIPTDEDNHALRNNGVGLLKDRAKKWASKVDQLFIERRFLTGHMFFTESFDYWHFFYFDQRDLATYNNHWEYGAHIHLINWLWPEYTAESIWKQFTNGNPIMKGSLHIKYIDEDI